MKFFTVDLGNDYAIIIVVLWEQLMGPYCGRPESSGQLLCPPPLLTLTITFTLRSMIERQSVNKQCGEKIGPQKGSSMVSWSPKIGLGLPSIVYRMVGV